MPDQSPDATDTSSSRTVNDAGADAQANRVERKLGIIFWIAAAWMALLATAAIFAPAFTEGHHFLGIDLGLIPDPRVGLTEGQSKNVTILSPGHPLGTDNLGRDILSRVIWGARISLTVGFASITFGLFYGGAIGLVAGFFRGRLETFLMAFMDVLLAFPALVLALAIVTFTDSKTMPVITLSIGLVAIPPIARLVRANTLTFSQREFVLASRTLGAHNSRIIWREIVPNVSRAAFSFAVIGVAAAIVAEGFLAFIGVSLPPPNPTWGTMINDGKDSLEAFPHITMVPAMVLFLTVMALNLAGDGLRNYFDVKETGL